VRRAFGRFTGLQVGWLNLLGRLTACAAAVNLLVISLGEFWPQAGLPVPRFAIETLVVGTLAAANYRGVAAGLGTGADGHRTRHGTGGTLVSSGPIRAGSESIPGKKAT
jgi:hypothetical protein